jgi:hypothetical protein
MNKDSMSALEGDPVSLQTDHTGPDRTLGKYDKDLSRPIWAGV